MRSLYLCVFLVLIGCGEGESIGGEKREVSVVCRNPRGGVEEYRVVLGGSVYGLTKSRSALWDFSGVRVRDGKRVEVMANDCMMEVERDE